jgi:uncharacterized membrane protein
MDDESKGSPRGGEGGDSKQKGSLSTHRLLGLSDGVFAIVMTILIIDLKFPQMDRLATSISLASEILGMWHRFEIYVVVFLTIGAFWIWHHIQFHFIRRSDQFLIWVNIVFLMMVSLLPFSTMLLGDHLEHDVTAMIFGLNLVLCTMLLYINWRHATRRYLLVDPDLDYNIICWERSRLIIIVGGFLAAFIISVFSMKMGMLLYLLTVMFQRVLLGLLHKREKAPAGLTQEFF